MNSANSANVTEHRASSQNAAAAAAGDEHVTLADAHDERCNFALQPQQVAGYWPHKRAINLPLVKRFELVRI